MRKKSLLVIVSLLFALSIAVIPAQAAAPSIVLNGQIPQCNTPPIIEDGSTLVPMRAVFEGLGAQVNWDNPTKTVTAAIYNTTVQLVISGNVKVNGQKLNTTAQAKIYNSTTMIPMPLVRASLVATADCNPDTQTVTITATETTTPAYPPIVIETPDDTTVEEEDDEDKSDTNENEEDTEEDSTKEEDEDEDEGDDDEDESANNTSFSSYLDELEDRFIPEKAEGVSTTYQFVITGDNEENYHIIIDDGELTTGEGTADIPDVTVTIDEQLWLDIVSGEENATEAYLDNKFTVNGDPSLILKLKEYIE